MRDFGKISLVCGSIFVLLEAFINSYELKFIYGGFVVKKSFNANAVGIKKSDTLGEVIDKYPEIAPVFAQAGLHCIGCHVSGYESIEQGCLAHGMKKNGVDELLKEANKRIAEYEKMPMVSFTPKAVDELARRRGKKKFVRLMQIFGGEFDFESADKKEKEEAVIEVVSGKKPISVISPARIERMLRGVVIDYDSKQKDFVAKRK